MKKILFALASILLVNMSVYSQEALKPESTGFDVPRETIAHGHI